MMADRKKCGLTVEEYVNKCPPLKKGIMPDNLRDCQGCQYGVLPHERLTFKEKVVQ